ncbi:MAG: 50S ribosomal protein L25 [Patescibacteria group bacterium]
MTTSLQTEKREVFGKQLTKLRQAGKLPVIVYGAKEKATPYFVEVKEFKKILTEAGESSVVTLHTDKGDKDILIHEVNFHPLSGEPIHADLLVVEANKPIKVDVELEFVGEAPAVKNLGAMLIKVRHELEVEALPKNLPHNLTVDLSSLENLDSKITVADIKLPTGVTTEVDLEEVVVAVSVAGEEVKEEEVPVDLSAIEVEKKGKTEEEGEEESEATGALGK